MLRVRIYPGHTLCAHSSFVSVFRNPSARQLRNIPVGFQPSPDFGILGRLGTRLHQIRIIRHLRLPPVTVLSRTRLRHRIRPHSQTLFRTEDSVATATQVLIPRHLVLFPARTPVKPDLLGFWSNPRSASCTTHIPESISGPTPGDRLVLSCSSGPHFFFFVTPYHHRAFRAFPLFTYSISGAQPRTLYLSPRNPAQPRTIPHNPIQSRATPCNSEFSVPILGIQSRARPRISGPTPVPFPLFILLPFLAIPTSILMLLEGSSLNGGILSHSCHLGTGVQPR